MYMTSIFSPYVYFVCEWEKESLLEINVIGDSMDDES